MTYFRIKATGKKSHIILKTLIWNGYYSPSGRTYLCLTLFLTLVFLLILVLNIQLFQLVKPNLSPCIPVWPKSRSQRIKGIPRAAESDTMNLYFCQKYWMLKFSGDPFQDPSWNTVGKFPWMRLVWSALVNMACILLHLPLVSLLSFWPKTHLLCEKCYWHQK